VDSSKGSGIEYLLLPTTRSSDDAGTSVSNGRPLTQRIDVRLLDRGMLSGLSSGEMVQVTTMAV
jgi:hypothetical protein